MLEVSVTGLITHDACKGSHLVPAQMHSLIPASNKIATVSRNAQPKIAATHPSVS